MWLARLAHSTCTAKSYLRTPDQRDYSSLDLEMLLQNGRQLQQKGECAQLMAVMWLQYRESTWPIIRRQVFVLSPLHSLYTLTSRFIETQDSRKNVEIANATLRSSCSAMHDFPKLILHAQELTHALICTIHSAAAQNQLEVKFASIVHTHSWSKNVHYTDNYVLSFTSDRSCLSCLSSKLLLSLFQVYAHMHCAYPVGLKWPCSSDLHLTKFFTHTDFTHPCTKTYKQGGGFVHTCSPACNYTTYIKQNSPAATPPKGGGGGFTVCRGQHSCS